MVRGAFGPDGRCYADVEEPCGGAELSFLVPFADSAVRPGWFSHLTFLFVGFAA